MKQFFLFLILFSTPFFTSTITAQEPGHRIEVSIDAYESDSIFLGYRRADKIYSKDTTFIADGKYVFEGADTLPPGIYLVLMPPDNKFFEFIVTKNEQHFSISAKAPNFFESLKFKGSKENQLMYDYQVFMNEQVELSKKVNEKLEQETDEKKKAKIEKQLATIGDGVKAYQKRVKTKHPGTFTAKLIAAFEEPDIPEAPLKADGTKDDDFAFKYYRAHYWDGFDLTDEVFVNSPYLKQKIDRYLDKLTMQTPDSVIVAVDYILERAQKNKQVFRYCLPYLLNKYFKPQIMGMDKVYVHLSDKYYQTGLADWVSEKVLKTITDNAFMMRGVLIGNYAPNVKVQLYSPEEEKFTTELTSPYDVHSEFTIVFLWKPGCPHCKKMEDKLKPFYEEWKDKGVEIFSISSANHMDLDKAIKDIKDKEMPWIITADPYQRARAMQRYYGTTLPKLYLLDKNKKIIANRIGVEQLPELIEEFRKKEANK